jgi:hypothetical protein
MGQRLEGGHNECLAPRILTLRKAVVEVMRKILAEHEENGV